MGAREVREHCRHDEGCSRLLEGAMRALGLSARGFARVLKVARTIADLAGEPQIGMAHIAGAIQYREQGRRREAGRSEGLPRAWHRCRAQGFPSGYHAAVEKRLAEMTEALHAAGFRVTPQRRAVLRCLAQSEAHPDAGRIHRAALRSLPNVSLATVYKTLAALKAAGQVLELEFSGQPNRYDGNRPQAHPHVICVACGRIVDPERSNLGPFLAAVACETGFAIHTSRVDFYGTCPACRRRGPDSRHGRRPA